MAETGKSKIKWVFFDIGDVLFNENAQHTYYFHSMLASMRKHKVDVAWDAYHQKISECVKILPATAITDAAQHFVNGVADWDAVYHDARQVYEAIRKPRPYGTLLDDFTGVLHSLKPEFNLGIVANQHHEVLDGVDNYGITPLFGVRVIDTMVGVSKPDPRIFQVALDQAGCRADEAIMVGDRPDNDIRPAKSIGLRTVRFRRGLLYSQYDAQTPEETADIEVTDVFKLADAIRSVAQ